MGSNTNIHQRWILGMQRGALSQQYKPLIADIFFSFYHTPPFLSTAYFSGNCEKR